MTALTEILIAAGTIQRRYLITEDRHTPEILAEWRPLVSRLMDRPDERQYHGMVGMPYWDASMTLPAGLDHPDLAGLTWLLFYGAPEATHPYYVGLVTLAESPQTEAGASVLSAISGVPEPCPAIAKEIAETAPNLAGTYVQAGLGQCPDVVMAARSTGECAAILAQLVLS